jgi:ribonuclease Z
MAVWRGEKDDFRLRIPRRHGEGGEGKELPLALLKEALSISPGQKIVYVSDCRFSEENIGKILPLAEGADLFFCEAAFLEKDRERAGERAHLTARQAGELARRAKVKKLHVFHFSPKYEGEAASLYEEAEEAFQGRSG